MIERKRSLNTVPISRAILYWVDFFHSTQELLLWADVAKIGNCTGGGCCSGMLRAVERR